MKENLPAKSKNPKKVFVVHGRNECARDAMFSFLRSLGLEPIEWSEAINLTGKASPYIGEILESAFNEAQAVVVLLTGDDICKLANHHIKPDDPDYERKPTPQARPNVLFEAGMAFGLHSERTILVQLGDMRPFSDIFGRHVCKLDDSSKTQGDLINRLITAQW